MRGGIISLIDQTLKDSKEVYFQYSHGRKYIISQSGDARIVSEVLNSRQLWHLKYAIEFYDFLYNVDYFYNRLAVKFLKFYINVRLVLMRFL